MAILFHHLVVFSSDYRSRQLVLSGQLRPFICLPGAAVIKQNEETGSNNEAKKWFFRWVPFFMPPLCLSSILLLHFHPSWRTSPSLGRQQGGGIYKSLVLRKLHPAEPYSWGCAASRESCRGSWRESSRTHKTYIQYFTSCQQIFDQKVRLKPNRHEIYALKRFSVQRVKVLEQEVQFKWIWVHEKWCIFSQF